VVIGKSFFSRLEGVTSYDVLGNFPFQKISTFDISKSKVD
jgi:hypothetical protein